MAKKATSKKSLTSSRADGFDQAAMEVTQAKTEAPTVDGILAELQTLGNETMRAHHRKNGAGDNMFGVKLGDIRVVANRIKSNHKLALDLWKTDNIDAQLLATLLIKPKNLSSEEMDQMVRSATFVQVADWLHSYVVKEHPGKEELRQEWMKSDHPMAARAGWRLTAGRVVKDPEGLDLPGLLDRIESEMGQAASEVQWTMNSCLAEIGIHFPKHRKRALAIGEKLGLYRDYPTSKGCTSPYAPIWINEMVKRQM